MFYLFSDAINKNFEVFKVFLKKILEFVLDHWYCSIMMLYILKPLQSASFMQKRGSKRNLVWLVGYYNLKIIFALQSDPIAIHTQIAIIKLEKPSFERLFLCFQNIKNCLLLGLVLALNKSIWSLLDSLLQIFISVLCHKLGGSKIRSQSGKKSM